MFSNEERCIYQKNQLIEVICQLRFPEILKIEAQEPFAFQDAIRAQYPQYGKKVERPPVQLIEGKPAVAESVNNYNFVSEDSRWKVSLTKSFIALSTHGYTRWEDFAKRLDVVLAAFIQTYAPAYFTRVGLRYINAFNPKNLELEDMAWKDLIQPGYLGVMADEDAPERAFLKCEQNIAVAVPGGSRANIKCGPGTLRKTNNRTKETIEEKVFMLDLDVYMEGKTPMNHAVPALNVVHGNAGSLFRGVITDTLHEAMQPEQA